MGIIPIQFPFVKECSRPEFRSSSCRSKANHMTYRIRSLPNTNASNNAITITSHNSTSKCQMQMSNGVRHDKFDRSQTFRLILSSFRGRPTPRDAAIFRVPDPIDSIH